MVDAVAESLHFEWWNKIESSDWEAVISKKSTPWRQLCRRVETEKMDLDSVVMLGECLEHFLETPDGIALPADDRATLIARVKILLQPKLLVLSESEVATASELVFQRVREIVPEADDEATYASIARLLQRIGPKSDDDIKKLQNSFVEMQEIHVRQRLVANPLRGIFIHGHYSSWEELHYFVYCAFLNNL